MSKREPNRIASSVRLMLFESTHAWARSSSGEARQRAHVRWLAVVLVSVVLVVFVRQN